MKNSKSSGLRAAREPLLDFLRETLPETEFTAPLLARIGPEYVPEVGAEYLLELDPARVHLFDAETGISLLGEASVEVGA